MKRSLFTLFLAAFVVACAGGAFAADMQKAEPGHKAGKAMMARYLVISPHTEAECVSTLDGVKGMGANALAKWDFGCTDGDHTGYCIVTASSSEEALKCVPEPVRAKARAIKMHKFTAAEIKSFHEHMKS